MSRQVAEGMGLQNHLVEADISLRRMLHPIWSDINRAEVHHLWQHHRGADARVNLCERSRTNLGRWFANSEVPQFRPVMVVFGSVTAWKVKSEDNMNSELLAKDGEIYVHGADVWSLHGWSYHCCRDVRVISGTWPREHRDKSTNWNEMWTTVELVRLESVQFWGWRVLVRSDNGAAVHCVNVRYGGVPGSLGTTRFVFCVKMDVAWQVAVASLSRSALDVIAGCEVHVFLHGIIDVVATAT